MSASPVLLARHVIGGQTFTEHRSLYVTPLGNCGVRRTYRIDGKPTPKPAYETAKTAALDADWAATQTA